MSNNAVIYKPRGRAGEYSPLACNLYIGCTHGCRYCYAPLCMKANRQNYHRTTAPRESILERLAHACRRLKAKDTPPGNVLLSFLSDPYQPAEDVYRITHQAIVILQHYGIPFTILTKAGRLARRDFAIYSSRDTFATTLTFSDNRPSLFYEPGASLPDERLANLAAAKQHGIHTWASIEPVIIPAQSLAMIRAAAPYVDLIKLGKLNYHPLAKEIDWPTYARAAVALCQELKKPYFLKADLAQHLEA